MLLFVLVVGGTILGVLMLRTLIPVVRADATTAKQRLASYVQIDLPEDYTPLATLDWKMLYLIPMSGVWIEADGGDSVIAIVRLEGAMASKPAVRERALEAVKDQAIGAGVVEKTEPLDDIRGAKVNSFVVRKAADQRQRVLTHSIALGDEHFIIDYQTPESQFEVDKVRALFKSIRPAENADQ